MLNRSGDIIVKFVKRIPWQEHPENEKKYIVMAVVSSHHEIETRT